MNRMKLRKLIRRQPFTPLFYAWIASIAIIAIAAMIAVANI